MHDRFSEFLHEELSKLKTEGLFKPERVISSQQQAMVHVNEQDVINLCANNYLGLANHPDLIAEGQRALAQYGYGMASVRFICGTQTPHKLLEKKKSSFLCKARRFRYANNDMKDLEAQLIAAKDARFRLIATDGVFSMDGTLANLPAICDLAEKYDAMVMVDDSHAVGFMGETGRGTPEHFGVESRIDIVTGTLGKALGGASGGYTASNGPIIEWLRQRSRPYLFSNTLAPVIAQTSIAVLDLLDRNLDLIKKLKRNSQYFREGLSQAGFTLIPGEHAIIPVMLGDASLAGRMASMLLAEGIYVVGFSFPVVPKGLARIRTQMSAAHELHHLDKALAAFEKVGRELGVL